MSYLIDTHVLIHLGTGEAKRLSDRVIEIYSNTANNLYISQISYWEMAIKINIGKLFIPIGLRNIILQTRLIGIEMIPIKNSHILFYENLQIMDNHKDPFDRLIVSAAIAEDLSIISSDTKFDLYETINRIW